MNSKEVLLANNVVFEFVLNLEEEDLKAVIRREKKIVLLDCEEKVIDEISSIYEKINEAISKLYLFSSKGESIKYLNEFRVVDLRKIAKGANIFVKSKSKKSEIIDRIVEGTIGAKIKMEILQT